MQVILKMKKFLFLLLALVCCLSTFVSCARDHLNSEGDQNSEEISEGNHATLFGKYGDIDFGGKDYLFKFKDDTLTTIYINPDVNNDICLTIPSLSDNENPIKHIRLQEVGFHILPVYTVESLENLIEQIKENSPSQRDFRTFRSYFSKYDLDELNESTTSESTKHEILEKYPIVEYTPVYVLDEDVTIQETSRLENLLTKYTTVDFEYLDKTAFELIERIPDNADCKEEYTDLLVSALRETRYGNYDKITQINFPKTTQCLYLDNDVFNNFKNLKMITGDFSNYYFDYYDFAPIDSNFISELKKGDEGEYDYLSDDIFFCTLVKSYDEGHVTVPQAPTQDESSESENNTETSSAVFSFGNYYNGTYIRSDPYLMWKLPNDEWRFYTHEELAQKSGMSASEFNETTLSQKSEWLIYDMFAERDNGTMVGVNVNKLNPFAAMLYDASIIHSEESINTLKNQFQSQLGNTVNVVITPSFVTKMGINYYALDIQYEISGAKLYTKSIVFLKNEYVYTISFSAESNDELESLCSSFGILNTSN